MLEGLYSLEYVLIMGNLSLLAFHECLDYAMVIGHPYEKMENGFCYLMYFSLREDNQFLLAG